jgi:nicotinate phosphoribosyltransferase
MSFALLTDLYELNMAASYLRRGMEQPATFSLFVRALPPDRGYLVAAGLESCLGILEEFRFEPEDLDHLRDVLHFSEADLRHFADLRFRGDVWAVPEGRVVFAGEPLLEVTAPIAQAQLVETLLLNQLTFQTAIASKAARCRVAARGRALVDFALRRTHGTDAGMGVARATAIAGFAATSNVEAGRRFGLQASGTMAHSYVEAFATERDAFVAHAEDFPATPTFLVDTYDTLGGVRTAIEVAQELGLDDAMGIRIDSGDLGALAREARRMLDAAGLGGARIVVSGGLDEFDVDALVGGASPAPIDAFGVGTRIGVSADAPSLDTVYKLVEYAGRPVRKLSQGKATAPGAKQILRHPSMRDDVVALRHERLEGYEPLLVPVMQRGRRIAGDSTSIDAARARFDADLALLPQDTLRLKQPESPPVRWSDQLTQLTERVGARLREER